MSRSNTLRPSRLSSAVAAALVLTALSAIPARAQSVACNGAYAGQCVCNTSGTPGPLASGGGQPGGNGGADTDFTLDLSGNQVFYTEGYNGNPNAAVNVSSVGGAGAQGANAPAGKFDTNGASGGTGGNGANITLQSGAGIQADSADSTMGASALTLTSTGGAGGPTSKGNLNAANGPANGVGGDGGAINATLDGRYTAETYAAGVITSTGGAGGRGRDWSTGLANQGADAANGGNGGNVGVTLQNVSANGSNGFFGVGGLSVSSVGGAGGNGGEAEDVDGSQGGTGGDGGNGAAVNLTVGSNVNVSETAALGTGLLVQSVGGEGGAGGTGGSGGVGGAGGNGGNVAVNVQGGSITAQGDFSVGLLAQSLGGNGGGGGSASMFVIGPNGGAGQAGGTAGTVSATGGLLTVNAGQAVAAAHTFAPGILLQSIGGGGGSGSAAKGVFAVGGDGGNGVSGNSATMDLQANVTNVGDHSDAIMVQSIGGGGGKGGDATGTSALVQMTVGGTGGGGGDGGYAAAQLRSGSAITTDGIHANGLLVQSVGGGGGSGGAAYSQSYSGFFGAAVAVGGSGGAGGNGQTVGLISPDAVTSAGRISTYGADSYGILGQSIGGGGGVGGASTASSKTYSTGDYGGLSLALSLGGTGGAGGNGGDVTIANSGLITSFGPGSAGMVGQSIGGGGGTGGDSSSAATASGGQFDFAASVAVGGAGGVAGDGGVANVVNNGTIVAAGAFSSGLQVQSIGGGGGNGGSGSATSSASGKDLKLSLSVGAGAKGGGAGDGYAVTGTNNGTIITLGDSSHGISAQSIGGGGGNGGGGAASGNSEISADLAIGGAGGAGGNAYHANGDQQVGVTTANNGSGAVILTYGADANAILAQSIGGGGGVGGSAATTISKPTSTSDGGNGLLSNVQTTYQNLQKAFDIAGEGKLISNGLQGAVTYAKGMLGIGSTPSSPTDDLDDLAQGGGAGTDNNKATAIHLQVAVGGAGGGGGSGGEVVVENDGAVATVGSMSDAILAQSIGGGGGKGGASSTATTDQYSGSVAVGGSGGDGGYGDLVQVTNTGTVDTRGVLAAGIVAQSIAGGGGVGGASASSITTNSKDSGNGGDNGAFTSMSLTLGGDGGTTYDSGQAMVTSSGQITTYAHDAPGIIAQSVSGGGGLLKSLATDLEAAGGSASASETNFELQLKFGGSTGIGSTSYGSGFVDVTTNKGGAIVTQGDNSYGILAQSIAGGGGAVLGGSPGGATVAEIFGTGAKVGSVLNYGNTDPTDNSGNDGLFVNVNDDVTTSGDGAIGVVAQSIGGGGGIAGGVVDTAIVAPFVTDPTTMSKSSGSGGYVGAVVGAGATVSTSGVFAPAMLLQSIGGGGGRVVSVDGHAYMGTAGGAGTGGMITAVIQGRLQATGGGSAGLFAQSVGDGSSTSPIDVTVGDNGVIAAGGALVEGFADGTGSAIYLDHGGTSANPNQVANFGTVQAMNFANATAVYSTGGYTAVENYGTMTGNVLLTNGGGSGCFSNYGTFNSGSSVTVGACGLVNSGVMNVSGAATGTTTVEGDYAGTGKIAFDADFVNGTGDKLVVNGKAAISGAIAVNPSTMRNARLPLVTATGGMTVDPALASVPASSSSAATVSGSPTAASVASDPGTAAAAAPLFTYAFDSDGTTLYATPKAQLAARANGLGNVRQAVASHLQTMFDSGDRFDAGFTALAKPAAADATPTPSTA